MEGSHERHGTEGLRLQEALQFDIGVEKLMGIDTCLGPGGVGTFKIAGALNPNQIETMQAEIFEPNRVNWHDNHDRFINRRGIEVVENHTAFALKLHRGDLSQVERVPHMRALAVNTEKLIRGLSGVFPNLYGWAADEMSLHRYDDKEVGLSFHKDNLRFIGLIAVITLEGSSDFLIKDDEGGIHAYDVNEGDLMLTRATGLYPSLDGSGKQINLCPDHAVVNLQTPYRTSFIVRANSRPGDIVPGFEYSNWDGED